MDAKDGQYTDTGWKSEPSHQGKGPVLLLGEGSQGGPLNTASGHSRHRLS